MGAQTLDDDRAVVLSSAGLCTLCRFFQKHLFAAVDVTVSPESDHHQGHCPIYWVFEPGSWILETSICRAKAAIACSCCYSRLGATDYVSGPAAKNYLDAELYAQSGVRVHWKDYNHYPEYPQLHGDYIPNLSIVDLLMNCGERAADYLWGYRGTHGSVAAQRHQVDGREP